jgi:hypothetical protein
VAVTRATRYVPPRMRAWLLVGSGSVVLSTACAGSRLADIDDNTPTLLRLAPSEFLGDVRCEPGTAGALQAYVVDLYALGPGADASLGETLVATSPEASCRTAVTFQAVHRQLYVADVRAYDQSPVEGVVPRWTSSCGRGADGVGPAPTDAGLEGYGPFRAAAGATVPIVSCTPLRAGTGEAAPGSIVVGLDAATLGGLRCGSGAGEVNDFSAELAGEVQAAACGSDVSFSNVPLGVEQTIRVNAFGAAGVPDAGAGVPDASLGGDGADAGINDAGIADASITPPVPGTPGSDAAPPASARRWFTDCVATAVADVATRAVCQPLQAAAD